jgi:hypothetical protein
LAISLKKGFDFINFNSNNLKLAKSSGYLRSGVFAHRRGFIRFFGTPFSLNFANLFDDSLFFLFNFTCKFIFRILKLGITLFEDLFEVLMLVLDGVNSEPVRRIRVPLQLKYILALDQIVHFLLPLLLQVVHVIDFSNEKSHISIQRVKRFELDRSFRQYA